MKRKKYKQEKKETKEKEHPQSPMPPRPRGFEQPNVILSLKRYIVFPPKTC
jgi:hypothetical protein